MTTQPVKRGDKITYTKHIMFKPDQDQEVTATIVAVTSRKILLDDGTTFFKI